MKRSSTAGAVIRPPAMDEIESDDDRPALDALQGWLILLPFAALSIPGTIPGAFSVFAGAPDTISIGIGAMALGALPAVGLATLRGRGGDAVGLAALFVLLAFAAFQLPRSADTFGAWRAMVGLAAAIGWTVAGASLGRRGRRVVAFGFPLVTLLLLAGTLFTPAWTGALGNTGDISEAALPGAVLCAGAVVCGRAPLSMAALVALLGYASYAGGVPVHAGVLGLGAALVAAIAALLFSRREGNELGRVALARRVRILLIAVLISVAAIGARTLVPGDGPAPDGAPGLAASGESDPAADDAATTTGGVAFRKLTWARIPSVLQDHAALGLGPGQFQAGFPPYRDPAEIELSTFDRKEPTPIEVEHAHNDGLTALAEYGLIGGGALLLFLLLTLARAVRQLTGEDETRRDFGLAAVAVLANATVNSNLLYSPLALLGAFVVLGVVAGPTDIRRARSSFDYIAPGLALAALAVLTPRALSYVEYGRALADIPSARIVLEDGREKLDAVSLGVILENAHRVRPDGPVVLEKRAQLLRTIDASLESQRANMRRWLQVRPHSFAGLLAGGALEARLGSFDVAHDRFDAALRLDPGHPALLRNMVRLGCDRRAPQEVEEALARLADRGLDDPAFLRSVAIEVMLEGRLDGVRQLVLDWSAGIEGGPIDVLDANATHQARNRARKDGDLALADAFHNAMRVRYGEDDLVRANLAQAVTQFRQAYQKARDAGIDAVDTANLRLRLAAVYAATGRVAEAKALIAEGELRREDYLRLSDAEREALEAENLLSGRAAISPR